MVGGGGRFCTLVTQTPNEQSSHLGNAQGRSTLLARALGCCEGNTIGRERGRFAWGLAGVTGRLHA